MRGQKTAKINDLGDWKIFVVDQKTTPEMIIHTINQILMFAFE